VTSSPQRLGKPAASDFGRGHVTLPALPALRRDPRMRALLRPGLSVREREWAAQTIREHGGHLVAMAAAHAFATRAACRLNAVPAVDGGRASAGTDALAALQRLPARYLRASIEQADPRARTELRRVCAGFVSAPPERIAAQLSRDSESLLSRS
jgi:hypothetical protein